MDVMILVFVFCVEMKVDAASVPVLFFLFMASSAYVTQRYCRRLATDVLGIYGTPAQATVGVFLYHIGTTLTQTA